MTSALSIKRTFLTDLSN